MAALRFFDVLTVLDEVIKADPEWVRTAYTPIACPRCKHVLPRNAGPIDVDVVEEPSGPSVIVGFPIGLELLRTDLFAALHTHMPEFFFGSVRANGRRLQRYVSVFAGDGVRMKEHADKHCEYAPCPQCGRVFQYLVTGNSWFQRADIGNRLVFSGVGGSSLYVADRLIDGLDAELRRELKLDPIDVRD